MSDFLIDLNSLNTKKTTLGELQSQVSTVGKSYNSTAIKEAKDGYNNVATKLTRNMERLTKGYTNSYTWLTGYTTDLDTLEQSLKSLDLATLTKPIEFKGQFEDIFGKITMPALKTGGDPNCNAISTVTANGDGTITVEVNGKTYTIANTEAELFDYYKNVILSQSLYQESSKKFDDQCLGFSYNYAYGLYANDRSINSSTIRNGTSYGNYFNKFNTNNESELLEKVYNEITSGKPVVLQVTGSRKNQTRHYVTVIGFDNSVKSAKDLKSTDLLIMDVYDGKIKNTVGKNASSGRCVVKGTELKKGRYNYGYEMYYIKT